MGPSRLAIWLGGLVVVARPVMMVHGLDPCAATLRPSPPESRPAHRGPSACSRLRRTEVHRAWLGEAATRGGGGLADVTRSETELRREVMVLRRRVGKLVALLRLALALHHASGFRLARARLPEGLARARMLRAIDGARAHVPLRGVLRFLGISARRVQAWRRRQRACTLGDRSSCPRTSPQRLTHTEVQAIGDMVTARAYRHVPTGRLAVLAQRLGTVCASPSTWYSLVRRHRWRRSRQRVHPRTPRVGARASRPDELWHIDTTVIRLLDGTRAYRHAVIDNDSRRILAWRVADRATAANSVAVLMEANGQATSPESTRDVLADGGVENANAQVDALVEAGIVRRLLALTECAYSNSLIEAWWRSLKHQWLFLHPLDSVATVRRLVAFYVDEHNRVIPHAAFRGLTPDEMYFGTAGPDSSDLSSRMAAARVARLQANRAACCPVCPALGAAG